jgi:adenosylhomocysteinase
MNQIEYAEEQMVTLKNYFKILNLAKYTRKRKIKILCSLLITKETGFFISELSKYGFDVRLVSSNPISTNLEVVKELKEQGIKVYWIKKDNNGDFRKLLRKSLNFLPDYIIDDGGDLVDLLQEVEIPSIKGCCEETTSGITIDKKIFNENHLKFPVIAVNNARTKNLMDNHFGTGQSTVDGIIRATQESWKKYRNLWLWQLWKWNCKTFNGVRCKSFNNRNRPNKGSSSIL